MEKKYKIETYHFQIDDDFEMDTLEDNMNRESTKGWEVVSVTIKTNKAVVVYFNMNFATVKK